MYRIDSCPCCGSDRMVKWPVMLAPFIAEYAVGEPLNTVDLARCLECECKYFTGRYNDSEIAALYANYRGEQYYNIRHRHEFWYTRSINNAFVEDLEMIRRRKEHLLETLRRHNIAATSLSAIDWGGDRGQHIPDIFRGKFVYEISDAVPVAGVTKLADMHSVEKYSFDIVMLCGVLEHCSDPADMVRLISGFNTKFIYVLVPYEPFKIIRVMPQAWHRKYMKFISRMPRLRPAVDLLTVICRLKFKLIPPFGILMQHEHLNFFTKDSIARLLINNGFEPIEAGSFNSSFGFNPGLFFCLARKK